MASGLPPRAGRVARPTWFPAANATQTPDGLSGYLLGRQFRSQDLVRIGIFGQVQLAARPTAALAVLLRLPLASAIHFQTCGVDHDRDRLSLLRQRSGPRETDTASGKGGVVGNRESDAEQGVDRAQQTFGLSPRSTKSRTQQRPRLTGQTRIKGDRPALACRRCLPSQIASGVTHKVKLPRSCNARSYSRQLFTLYFVLGI